MYLTTLVNFSDRIPSAGSTVLVTGGAGFVGAVVSRRLLDRGHRVIVADHGREPRHVSAREQLSEARLDCADLLNVDLVDLLEGVDNVVHFAGQPGVQTSWGEGFSGHVQLNIELTQRLLEAALVQRPRRVVVASSSSVYGHTGVGFATESDPIAPLSPYGVSKAAVEHLVRAYAQRGVHTTALRLFTVYGRGQRPDMAIARMIDAALAGRPFALRGSGDQVRDFTHVDDVSAAVESALFTELPAGLVINVGCGRPVALRDVINMVSEGLGHRVPVVGVPAQPGDPARTAADAGLARTLLGWTPTVPIEAGIADQIVHHPSRSQPQPAAAARG